MKLLMADPTPRTPSARIALGLALKEAREETGLSANTIAKRLPPGREDKDRDRSTIYRWENGEGFPSEEALAVYKELTGWTADKLLRRAADIILEASKRRGPGASA